MFISPVLPTFYDRQLLSCLGMIWIENGDFEMAFVCSMLMARLGLSSPPSRPLPRPSLLCSAKTTASPSRVASLCRSLPDTSLAPIRFVSLSARQQAGDRPLAPGPLVYRFAVLLRLLSHEEMAVLSSSQATPMRTCPALRLRWCPLGLPYRLQDARLPARKNRRLSPAPCRVILSDHNNALFGALQRGLHARYTWLRTHPYGTCTQVRYRLGG